MGNSATFVAKSSDWKVTIKNDDDLFFKFLVIGYNETKDKQQVDGHFSEKISLKSRPQSSPRSYGSRVREFQSEK